MYIDEQLQLPRLTGTLRAFSKVSKRYEELDPALEKNLIKKRKEQLLNKTDSSTNFVFTWQNVTTKLIPNPSDSKFSKLKSFLDKLRTSIAKQFLNEDFNDSSLLNEASLFILESFYDFRNMTGAGNSNFQNIDKLSKRLKERFGQFQRNLFDTCRDLMETIFNELIYLNRINLLDEVFSSRKVEVVDSNSRESEKSTEHYFGENIKLYSFYEDKLNNQELTDEGIDSSEDETDEEDSNELKFEFPTDSTREGSTGPGPSGNSQDFSNI